MNKIFLFWLFFFANILAVNASSSHKNLNSCKSSFESSCQNKWRIGIGIGLEYFNAEARLKDKYPFGGHLINEREQTKKNFQISPSVEIGKTCFNDFYFGILINWHPLKLQRSSRASVRNATYLQHNLKISHHFDILAKVGYKLDSKRIAYILLGPSIVKWSHVTDKFTDSYKSDEKIPSKTKHDDSFKISDTTKGLGIGLGIEQIIHKNFLMSINYNYNTYKAKSEKKIMTYKDPIMRKLHTGEAEKNIKLSSNTLSIRLSYLF